ncbi:Predicted arabinose efflux permease, MFS family [Chitinophaga eiseniae]|uniref:Predicted arabinose efflux permease, MFS family n=1 Tax=Chitinophaga eiseniae TaxID=634771 RepID=A0A1T4Q4U9_9BACT|nr:MFS transporter [Chitinophaga eiseniae]SJZ98815.1 Predicted arabinose efflux permease, MFS family [Chitinophaga eiseniae]
MEKRIILTVACMAIFFEALDVSVLNMALPGMQTYFHFGPDAIQWVQTVYVLMYAGFVLLGGRLSDTMGRRKIFITGAFLFVLASLGAGFSMSFAWLLVCRGLQGLGVALAIPAAMAIISHTFTVPAEKNRAFGIFGAMAGIGFATGLAIGGLISAWMGWQWVFFINVPVIGAAILLAYRFIPRDRQPEAKQDSNLLSGILITLLLMLTAWLIHDLGHIAAHPAGFVLLLAVLLTVGVYFVKRERVHASPLVDFDLFRLKGVITGNVGATLLGSTFLPYVFLLTLYLQEALGFSSSTAGLLLFPFSILSGLISKYLLPHLFHRLGVTRTGIAGSCFMLGGILFFGLSYFTAWHLPFMLLAVLCINSLGMSITFPAITILAIQAVPETQHGLASGINGTCNAMGGGLGLSLVGLMMQLAVVNQWNSYAAGLVVLALIATGAILQLYRFWWRESAVAEGQLAEIPS